MLCETDEVTPRLPEDGEAAYWTPVTPGMVAAVLQEYVPAATPDIAMLVEVEE